MSWKVVHMNLAAVEQKASIRDLHRRDRRLLRVCYGNPSWLQPWRSSPVVSFSRGLFLIVEPQAAQEHGIDRDDHQRGV
jgi:hypothetical protein